MSKSEPLRTNQEIEKIKRHFSKRNQWRNYALFTLGINTALRISDILQLTWDSVYDFKANEYKRHLNLIEHKTGKPTSIALNENIIAALSILKEQLGVIYPEEYIIKSRNGYNKPIHRSRAYIIIREAAIAAHIDGTICCHSLRKTFGYHAWNQGIHPSVIMEIYNHSSMDITRKYLSINQDDKDKVFYNLLL